MRCHQRTPHNTKHASTQTHTHTYTKQTTPKQFLFSAADIFVGWQLWRLAALQRAPPRAALAAAAAWLCNPFTFAISTRGSCDALAAAPLVGALLLLLRGRRVLAALLYGVAVHARIYPIIYAPATVLFLARRRLALAARRQQQQQPQQRKRQGRSSSRSKAGTGAAAAGAAAAGAATSWRAFAGAVAREALEFGGVSGGVFFALGLLFYRLYGEQFLHEAFLHHLGRRDPRHCFAPHWYSVYLGFERPWPAAAGEIAARQGLSAASAAAAAAGSSDITAGAGAAAAAPALLRAAAAALSPERLAPLPQLAALLALAAALHRDLAFCWLLTTVAFVALNKVSTAQYFVWWLALLPAALPGLRVGAGFGGGGSGGGGGGTRRGGGGGGGGGGGRSWGALALPAAAAAWAAAQLHWLLWGYLLEFEGRAAHLALWAAGLAFLAAGAALVAALLRAWDPDASFLELSLRRDDGDAGDGDGGDGDSEEAAEEEED